MAVSKASRSPTAGADLAFDCDDEVAAVVALIDWETVEKRAAQRAKSKIDALSEAQQARLAAAMLRYADAAAGAAFAPRLATGVGEARPIAPPELEALRSLSTLAAQLADCVETAQSDPKAGLSALEQVRLQMGALAQAAEKAALLAVDGVGAGAGLAVQRLDPSPARAGAVLGAASRDEGDPFLRLAMAVAAALDVELTSFKGSSAPHRRCAALLWELWVDSAEALLHLPEPARVFSNAAAMRRALASAELAA
ncbi:MAG: hypothetical protein AAF909_08915 [Pseudomonadota bacterium]